MQRSCASGVGANGVGTAVVEPSVTVTANASACVIVCVLFCCSTFVKYRRSFLLASSVPCRAFAAYIAAFQSHCVDAPMSLCDHRPVVTITLLPCGFAR